MTELLVMAGGIFVLALLSGMLGFGVALAAIPFLSLFLPDLVRHGAAAGACAGGRDCAVCRAWVPSERAGGWAHSGLAERVGGGWRRRWACCWRSG
jgi:hypothetical protein